MVSVQIVLWKAPRVNRLRILYCALGDDYGDPDGGSSFEAATFPVHLERELETVVNIG